MGFVKWLLQQYKEYKIEQSFSKPSQSEKDRIFMNNYVNCLEAGFDERQLNSLMNLMLCTEKRGGRE